MKSKILLVTLIVIGMFFTLRETLMDKLMEVEFPISIKEGSGIQFYDPKRNSTADVADQLEHGLVTVVYFYKSSCKSCQIFDTNLNKMVSFRPDIAVTKIPGPGIGGFNAAYMGKELNIRFLPFIMIFDREGKLVAEDNGDKHEGYDLFYEWLEEEVDRKNAQLKEEWIRNQKS